MHNGLPVKGYQSQSDDAVNIVNLNKELEEVVLRQLDMLMEDPGIDQNWLAMGRAQIEQGFMAVNRSVFKPGRVRLADDHG